MFPFIFNLVIFKPEITKGNEQNTRKLDPCLQKFPISGLSVPYFGLLVPRSQNMATLRPRNGEFLCRHGTSHSMFQNGSLKFRIIIDPKKIWNFFIVRATSFCRTAGEAKTRRQAQWRNFGFSLNLWFDFEKLPYFEILVLKYLDILVSYFTSKI